MHHRVGKGLMVICKSVTCVQGEVVAENGTMSGGGSRVVRGKMRLGSAAPVVADPTQSRAELAAAEERLQQLEKQLQEYQHAAVENGQRADAAAKAQESAAMEFQKICLAVESGARKCKELKQQLMKLDASMQVRTCAGTQLH
eukprot:jgi/Ulvmu1/4585/UM002_0314.1